MWNAGGGAIFVLAVYIPVLDTWALGAISVCWFISISRSPILPQATHSVQMPPDGKHLPLPLYLRSLWIPDEKHRQDDRDCRGDQDEEPGIGRVLGIEETAQE